MNVTEANAAQTVIAWLTGLVVVEDEHHTDPGRRVASDDRLIDAVTVLAARSSAALGAGMTGDDAARRVRALLEVTDGTTPALAATDAALDVDPEAYRDDQDDEDVFARAEAGL